MTFAGEMEQQYYVAGDALHVPHVEKSCVACDLGGLSHMGCDSCRRVPLARWDVDAIVVA